MKISCSVSIGELVDKISILKVKLKNITSAVKAYNVKKEYEELIVALNFLELDDVNEYINKLEKINQKLWDIEDNIRKKEKNKSFDDDFIKLARSVYKTNDERFKIKNEINEKYNSTIREEKDYEDYE